MPLIESYIGNWRQIPDDWIIIQVCRPDVLSPSKELLADYKQGRITWEGYEKRFEQEFFGNPKAVARLKKLKKIAETATVCLLCYEKHPPCHRFLLLEYAKRI